MDLKHGENSRGKQVVKVIEFDINAKDYIKLNFLSEVINTSLIDFFVFLEIDGIEKNFKNIRADKSVYRFNNFNVSEDATQNVITFRPVVIGCYSYFKIITSTPVKIDIVKNGTTTVAKEFIVPVGETKIEFDPQGVQRYVMRLNDSVQDNISNAVSANATVQATHEVSTQPTVDPLQNPFGDFDGFDGIANIQTPSPTSVIEERKIEASPFEPSLTSYESSVPASSVPVPTNQGISIEDRKNYEERMSQLDASNSRLESDISNIEAKIRELESMNASLVSRKRNLIEYMDKLQAEYDKDYQSYEADVEEIKSKYMIDDEILKMYAGKDVVSIEELLQRAEADISQIEEQIRVFVEAQQRKTADIENELRIGKKE